MRKQRDFHFCFPQSSRISTLCGECESPAVDDALTLLRCSFCNHSFQNSTECLGKAGGEIVAAHFVESETREWACPRYLKDTLSKARRAVKKPP